MSKTFYVVYIHNRHKMSSKTDVKDHYFTNKAIVKKYFNVFSPTTTLMIGSPFV